MQLRIRALTSKMKRKGTCTADTFLYLPIERDELLFEHLCFIKHSENLLIKHLHYSTGEIVWLISARNCWPSNSPEKPPRASNVKGSLLCTLQKGIQWETLSWTKESKLVT